MKNSCKFQLLGGFFLPCFPITLANTAVTLVFLLFIYFMSTSFLFKVKYFLALHQASNQKTPTYWILSKY